MGKSNKTNEAKPESFEQAMKRVRCYLGIEVVSEDFCPSQETCDECLFRSVMAMQMYYERDTRNPSLAYSLKSAQDDCMMLANAREYERGYRDGKKAKSADEWMLDRERKLAASRLSGERANVWDDGGTALREVTRAVCGVEPRVSTRENVKMLVDSLTHLLVGKELEYDSRERFCERHGWCGMGSGACDGCDMGWHLSEIKDGGDECNFSTHEIYTGTEEVEENPAETSDDARGNVSSDIHSITDELREWRKNIKAYIDQEDVLSLRANVMCFADRIDDFFDRVCSQEKG